ncbi:MAG: hypothetical protein ABI888_02570 [Chloroflexota bacterium]
MSSLIGNGRGLGIGVLAGLLAGFLAGGIGGRLAMRLIAVVAGPSSTGQLTDNGNAVGDITTGGTVVLVVFSAVLNGVVGGLVYAALRSSLAPLGRARSLVFGLLILLGLGFTTIAAENRDFTRFGSPILNVALFAAIFVAFGALIVPLAERLDRAVPRTAVSRSGPAGIGLALLVGLSLLAGLLTLALFIVTTAQTLAGVAAPGTGFGLTTSFVLLGLLASAVLARVGSAFPWSRLPLAVPVLAGTWLTLRSIATILGVG